MSDRSWGLGLYFAKSRWGKRGYSWSRIFYRETVKQFPPVLSLGHHATVVSITRIFFIVFGHQCSICKYMLLVCRFIVCAWVCISCRKKITAANHIVAPHYVPNITVPVDPCISGLLDISSTIGGCREGVVSSSIPGHSDPSVRAGGAQDQHL